ncbi:MAG: hypothetical protein FJX18_02255 [Alphaproteobacteria bacterium]|nr:hypothetical protein [Alphaproteobacteria bacterium]
MRKLNFIALSSGLLLSQISFSVEDPLYPLKVAKESTPGHTRSGRSPSPHDKEDPRAAVGATKGKAMRVDERRTEEGTDESLRALASSLSPERIAKKEISAIVDGEESFSKNKEEYFEMAKKVEVPLRVLFYKEYGEFLLNQEHPDIEGAAQAYFNACEKGLSNRDIEKFLTSDLGLSIIGLKLEDIVKALRNRMRES